jgi:amino acid transporter
MQPPGDPPPSVSPQLGLWDAISIIVGIVVGVGLYETPPDVYEKLPGPVWGLGIWALGGLLALIGALCYAELASTYPRSGGDYVYLTRAYGSWAGFLFAWAQITVIRSGNIGMMAYIFADYANRLWSLGSHSSLIYALLTVLLLTGMNALGIVLGKGTQNVLTAAKVLGLGGILLAGLFSPSSAASLTPASATPFNWEKFGLAMVFVLYTYGGWNDAALVAADQRRGKRNIPLALILGTCIIAFIYILINAAYLVCLGYDRAQHSKAIAADVIQGFLGEHASRVMCVLVMVSALGAINGMVFTGSRIYSALGSEHRLFAWLGRWDARSGAPLWSLLTQTVFTVALILLVGTPRGLELINGPLTAFGFAAVPFEDRGGFSTLLKGTAPAFWVFFLLTAVSLFVLRWKDRSMPRVFAVPLYPVLPIIFCATCAYMLYAAVDYAGKLTLVPAVLILAGLLIGGFSRRQEATPQAEFHRTSV